MKNERLDIKLLENESFWRNNEIEALKMMLEFRDKSTAVDPEDLESIIKNLARLKELREQEFRITPRSSESKK